MPPGPKETLSEERFLDLKGAEGVEGGMGLEVASSKIVSFWFKMLCQRLKIKARIFFDLDHHLRALPLGYPRHYLVHLVQSFAACAWRRMKTAWLEYFGSIRCEAGPADNNLMHERQKCRGEYY